jgi:hypothetical protein
LYKPISREDNNYIDPSSDDDMDEDDEDRGFKNVEMMKAISESDSVPTFHFSHSHNPGIQTRWQIQTAN